MAISKSVTLPNGNVATYWKVENVFVSPGLDSVRAFVHGYADAGASVSGVPLTAKEVVLQGQSNPLNAGALERLLETSLVGGGDSDLNGGSVV